MKHVSTLIALLVMALLLVAGGTSCGSAAGLAAQPAQNGISSDDGTVDQGRGDFGVGGSGGSGASTNDDGTPDQGSGDFGVGGVSSGNSTDDDGTPDQGRGDRGADRDDDDNSGRG